MARDADFKITIGLKTDGSASENSASLITSELDNIINEYNKKPKGIKVEIDKESASKLKSEISNLMSGKGTERQKVVIPVEPELDKNFAQNVKTLAQQRIDELDSRPKVKIDAEIDKVNFGSKLSDIQSSLPKLKVEVDESSVNNLRGTIQNAVNNVVNGNPIYVSIEEPKFSSGFAQKIQSYVQAELQRLSIAPLITLTAYVDDTSVDTAAQGQQAFKAATQSATEAQREQGRVVADVVKETKSASNDLSQGQVKLAADTHKANAEIEKQKDLLEDTSKKATKKSTGQANTKKPPQAVANTQPVNANAAKEAASSVNNLGSAVETTSETLGHFIRRYQELTGTYPKIKSDMMQRIEGAIESNADFKSGLEYITKYLYTKDAAQSVYKTIERYTEDKIKSTEALEALAKSVTQQLQITVPYSTQDKETASQMEDRLKVMKGLTEVVMLFTKYYTKINDPNQFTVKNAFDWMSENASDTEKKLLGLDKGIDAFIDRLKQYQVEMYKVFGPYNQDLNVDSLLQPRMDIIKNLAGKGKRTVANRLMTDIANNRDELVSLFIPRDDPKILSAIILDLESLLTIANSTQWADANRYLGILLNTLHGFNTVDLSAIKEIAKLNFPGTENIPKAEKDRVASKLTKKHKIVAKLKPQQQAPQSETTQKSDVASVQKETEAVKENTQAKVENAAVATTATTKAQTDAETASIQQNTTAVEQNTQNKTENNQVKSDGTSKAQIDSETSSVEKNTQAVKQNTEAKNRLPAAMSDKIEISSMEEAYARYKELGGTGIKFDTKSLKEYNNLLNEDLMLANAFYDSFQNSYNVPTMKNLFLQLRDVKTGAIDADEAMSNFAEIVGSQIVIDTTRFGQAKQSIVDIAKALQSFYKSTKDEKMYTVANAFDWLSQNANESQKAVLNLQGGIEGFIKAIKPLYTMFPEAVGLYSNELTADTLLNPNKKKLSSMLSGDALENVNKAIERVQNILDTAEEEGDIGDRTAVTLREILDMQAHGLEGTKDGRMIGSRFAAIFGSRLGGNDLALKNRNIERISGMNFLDEYAEEEEKAAKASSAANAESAKGAQQKAAADDQAAQSARNKAKADEEAEQKARAKAEADAAAAKAAQEKAEAERLASEKASEEQAKAEAAAKAAEEQAQAEKAAEEAARQKEALAEKERQAQEESAKLAEQKAQAEQNAQVAAQHAANIAVENAQKEVAAEESATQAVQEKAEAQKAAAAEAVSTNNQEKEYLKIRNLSQVVKKYQELGGTKFTFKPDYFLQLDKFLNTFTEFRDALYDSVENAFSSKTIESLFYTMNRYRDSISTGGDFTLADAEKRLSSIIGNQITVGQDNIDKTKNDIIEVTKLLNQLYQDGNSHTLGEAFEYLKQKGAESDEVLKHISVDWDGFVKQVMQIQGLFPEALGLTEGKIDANTVLKPMLNEMQDILGKENPVQELEKRFSETMEHMSAIFGKTTFTNKDLTQTLPELIKTLSTETSIDELDKKLATLSETFKLNNFKDADLTKALKVETADEKVKVLETDLRRMLALLNAQQNGYTEEQLASMTRVMSGEFLEMGPKQVSNTQSVKDNTAAIKENTEAKKENNQVTQEGPSGVIENVQAVTQQIDNQTKSIQANTAAQVENNAAKAAYTPKPSNTIFTPTVDDVVNKFENKASMAKNARGQQKKSATIVGYKSLLSEDETLLRAVNDAIDNLNNDNVTMGLVAIRKALQEVKKDASNAADAIRKLDMIAGKVSAEEAKKVATNKPTTTPTPKPSSIVNPVEEPGQGRTVNFAVSPDQSQSAIAMLQSFQNEYNRLINYLRDNPLPLRFKAEASEDAVSSVRQSVINNILPELSKVPFTIKLGNITAEVSEDIKYDNLATSIQSLVNQATKKTYINFKNVGVAVDDANVKAAGDSIQEILNLVSQQKDFDFQIKRIKITMNEAGLQHNGDSLQKLLDSIANSHPFTFNIENLTLSENFKNTVQTAIQDVLSHLTLEMPTSFDDTLTSSIKEHLNKLSETAKFTVRISNIELTKNAIEQLGQMLGDKGVTAARQIVLNEGKIEKADVPPPKAPSVQKDNIATDAWLAPLRSQTTSMLSELSKIRDAANGLDDISLNNLNQAMMRLVENMIRIEDKSLSVGAVDEQFIKWCEAMNRSNIELEEMIRNLSLVSNNIGKNPALTDYMKAANNARSKTFGALYGEDALKLMSDTSGAQDANIQKIEEARLKLIEITEALQPKALAAALKNGDVVEDYVVDKIAELRALREEIERLLKTALGVSPSKAKLDTGADIKYAFDPAVARMDYLSSTRMKARKAVASGSLNEDETKQYTDLIQIINQLELKFNELNQSNYHTGEEAKDAAVGFLKESEAAMELARALPKVTSTESNLIKENARIQASFKTLDKPISTLGKLISQLDQEGTDKYAERIKALQAMQKEIMADYASQKASSKTMQDAEGYVSPLRGRVAAATQEALDITNAIAEEKRLAAAKEETTRATAEEQRVLEQANIMRQNIQSNLRQSLEAGMNKGETAKYDKYTTQLNGWIQSTEELAGASAERRAQIIAEGQAIENNTRQLLANNNARKKQASIKIETAPAKSVYKNLSKQAEDIMSRQGLSKEEGAIRDRIRTAYENLTGKYNQFTSQTFSGVEEARKATNEFLKEAAALRELIALFPELTRAQEKASNIRMTARNMFNPLKSESARLVQEFAKVKSMGLSTTKAEGEEFSQKDIFEKNYQEMIKLSEEAANSIKKNFKSSDEAIKAAEAIRERVQAMREYLDAVKETTKAAQEEAAAQAKAVEDNARRSAELREIENIVGILKRNLNNINGKQLEGLITQEQLARMEEWKKALSDGAVLIAKIKGEKIDPDQIPGKTSELMPGLEEAVKQTNELIRVTKEAQKMGNLGSNIELSAAKKVETRDLSAELKGYQKELDNMKRLVSSEDTEMQQLIQDVEEKIRQAIQKLEEFKAKSAETFSDTGAIEQYANEIRNMFTGIQEGNAKINEALGGAPQSYADTVQSLAQQSKDIDTMLKAAEKTASTDAQRAEVEEIKSAWEQAKLAVKEYSEAGVGGFKNVETLTTETNKIKEETASILERTRAIYEETAVRKKRNTLEKQAEDLAKKVNNALNNYTKARYGKSSASYSDLKKYQGEIQSLLSDLESGKGTLEGLRARLTELQKNVTSATNSIIAAHENTRTFGERIAGLARQFSYWFSASRIIMSVVRSIRQLLNASIELEDKMTQLKIVTRDTDDAYARYMDTISKTAKQTATSISDLIESSTTYARLGYNLEESGTLASLTGMLENVGDIEVQDATDAITSIVKAFDIPVDQVEKVMDELVVTGNNFPVSVEQLSEGLTNASSALAASGNSFEESVALLTAANTTMVASVYTVMYKTQVA